MIWASFCKKAASPLPSPVGKGVPTACVSCLSNYEEKPRKHIFKGYHFFEMVVLLRC